MQIRFDRAGDSATCLKKLGQSEGQERNISRESYDAENRQFAKREQGLVANSGASVCNLTLIYVSYFPQTLTFSVDCLQDALPSVSRTEGESPRSGALRLIR